MTSLTEAANLKDGLESEKEQTERFDLATLVSGCVDGYQSMQVIAKGLSPQDTLELVKASGLKGRGGAGFPTGLKWSFVPSTKLGRVGTTSSK